MLDQLTHVPEAGDVLLVADCALTVAQVDKQRTRSCVTGTKLLGRGSIGVLVHESTDELKVLAQHPSRLWVTWTPKHDLPWHFNTDDVPKFKRLNEDWNAHPNAPNLRLEQSGQTLLARMKPNPYVVRRYEKIAEITITFGGCAKYRVTPVNDEAWYGGQCRFSGLAPSWGEFYEISGNTRDDLEPSAWIEIGGSGTCHFHFYLKDETLEVKAVGWAMNTGNLILDCPPGMRAKSSLPPLT